MGDQAQPGSLYWPASRLGIAAGCQPAAAPQHLRRSLTPHGARPPVYKRSSTPACRSKRVSPGKRCRVSVQATEAARRRRLGPDSATSASQRSRASPLAWRGASSSCASGMAVSRGSRSSRSPSGAERRSRQRCTSLVADATWRWAGGCESDGEGAGHVREVRQSG